METFSLESFTAVLKERLDNLSENNTREHAIILKKIEDLCNHVNEENERMNTRIASIEKTEFKEQITWKVLGKIAGTSVTIVGVAVLLVKFILGV